MNVFLDFYNNESIPSGKKRISKTRDLQLEKNLKCYFFRRLDFAGFVVGVELVAAVVVGLFTVI